MTQYRKELAKVTNVRLIIERDFLTFEMTLDFGTYQQVFGGAGLSQYDAKADRHVGTAFGADYLLQVMQLFGVEQLDAIRGKAVYALYFPADYNSEIRGLEIPAPFGEGRFVTQEWHDYWKARDWK